MLSEALADTSTVLNQIDFTDETKSENNDIYIYKPYTNKPQPKLLRQQLKYIDFEQYVKDKFKNKIQILNRKNFHLIKKPIVLAFNHFHEKCAYHSKWLDRIYALALKYGEHIEFIVADIFDLDIIYPGRNPINFFSRLVKSEDVTLSVYAINEKKHIHQHFDAYNSVDTLMELCENLLSGKLYPSLPLPKNNHGNMVKTCVHDNYEELILKSHKNIFLIINAENYQFYEYEPNYHNVAKALKHYNIDIVYMDAERNYIPFEYHVSYYPTLVYLPYNDKDFVYYDEPREEKSLIAYLKTIMDNPEFLKVQQQNLKSQILRKTVQVPQDFQIEFNDLTKFLEDNFNNNLKTLNRNVLENTKDTVIIVFMDFQHGKCLQHHVQWLNKIYQVAENVCTFQYFIADFRDIDIINTRWQTKDLIEKSQGKPKIYAVDRLKHTYELKSFDSIAKLYYFTETVQSGDVYYTQSYPKQIIYNSWLKD